MPAIGPGLLNSLLIPNVGDIERPQGAIADIKSTQARELSWVQ